MLSGARLLNYEENFWGRDNSDEKRASGARLLKIEQEKASGGANIREEKAALASLARPRASA